MKMNIQNAYNNWADTYDEDKNLTRDLDKIVTEENLGKLYFRNWMRDRKEHSFIFSNC